MVQTSGRGFGGQGARTGDSMGNVFEGGQMPLTRRLPNAGSTMRRSVALLKLLVLNNCALSSEK